MKFSEIDFPEQLLAALHQNRLVVFAGAGVSMGKPANLPDFKCLAEKIAEGTGETIQSQEQEDYFLGRLQRDKKVKIHDRAREILTNGDPKPTDLHRNLLRLYIKTGQVRIVTTNFDLLFEQAAEEVLSDKPEIFRAPALPLGSNFNGIVHIHGSVICPDGMVLTDADFGRAYLTENEGWARRFLVNLFQSFTVLFVGYSHNDIIVNYLARALLPEDNKRFALTKKNGDNSAHWKELGIEPLVYPADNDHSALCKDIQSLADTINKDTLDWQHEITEIAKNPPSIDEEKISVIKYALEKAETTRFFTKAAQHPEWLDWLDRHNYLDRLFKEGDLRDRDSVLARWLGKHFVLSHADNLFFLIKTHGMRLNSFLWDEIEWNLREETDLDDKILSCWISVLLDTLPANPDQYVLLLLGKCCSNQNVLTSLLQVFNTMMINLFQKQGFFWFDGDDDEHRSLNDLWQEKMKPKLHKVAEPLLMQIVQFLEKRHFELTLWGRESEVESGDNLHRLAIEPHEQNGYPAAIDVVIDASRDCLEWLISNQPDTARYWCNRVGNSEVLLLRRLSMYALYICSDLTDDQKLDWLLEHEELHNHLARHEVFQVAKLAYPNASLEHRKKFVQAILKYRWPDEKDENKENRTAYSHFNWLNWLRNAAPEDDLIKRSLDKISVQYPRFKPREYPDLTHHSSGKGSYINPQSPWSVGELLAKPATGWLPELLDYQPEQPYGIDKEELISTVTKAVEQKPNWGNELADALIRDKKWDAYLWPGLIRAWSKMNLNEDEHREVLRRLDNVNLCREHTYPITEALKALVEKGGRSYVLSLLPRAHKIAETLWDCLDNDQEEVSEEFNGWLTQAINHPAGNLAIFWTNSLSLWMKQQDPTPKTLNDEYRQIFSRIVKDSTLRGKLGRSFLANQFAFFLAVDKEWTREHLLLLFDVDESNEDFEVAWDGFLTQGHLNPAVAKLLEEYFLKVMERFERYFPDNQRRKNQHRNFVQYYTTLLMLFIEDPIKRWIPTLFNHGGMDIRYSFAWNIGCRLHNLNEARRKECWQRWLKKYWENRLQGVPSEIEVEEVAPMLEWLLYLEPVFPEAVALAVRMPNKVSGRVNVINRLENSNLLQRYPNDVVKLLMYCGTLNLPRVELYKLPKIQKKLAEEANLSSESKIQLQELLAKFG